MRSRESSVAPTSNWSSASGGCLDSDSVAVTSFRTQWAKRKFYLTRNGMSDQGPDEGLKNTFYRKTTRSSRTMTPLRRLLYAMAVPLGLGIIRSWVGTCRIVRVSGVENLEAALA